MEVRRGAQSEIENGKDRQFRLSEPARAWQ
jgi:hypothetical protein